MIFFIGRTMVLDLNCYIHILYHINFLRELMWRYNICIYIRWTYQESWYGYELVPGKCVKFYLWAIKRYKLTFSTLNVCTRRHEQREHISEKKFGMRFVVREICALFVLLGEGLFHRDFVFLHSNLCDLYAGHISVNSPSYSTLDMFWDDRMHKGKRSVALVLFCEPYKGVVRNACQSTRTMYWAFWKPWAIIYSSWELFVHPFFSSCATKLGMVVLHHIITVPTNVPVVLFILCFSSVSWRQSWRKIPKYENFITRPKKKKKKSHRVACWYCNEE